MNSFLKICLFLFLSLQLFSQEKLSNSLEIGGLLGGRGTLNNAVFTPGIALQFNVQFAINQDAKNSLLIGPSIGWHKYSSLTSFPISLQFYQARLSKKLDWDGKLGYAFTSDSKYDLDQSLESRNGFYFSLGIIGKTKQKILAGWKLNLDLLQTGVNFSSSRIQSQSRSNFVFIRAGILLNSTKRKTKSQAR